MLAIVAARDDPAALALLGRWAPLGAALLTSEDLSTPGWRYQVGASGSTAVVGGECVASAELTGVVTLLPGVPAWELAHVVPEDRAYVAQEMTAFLAAWLAQLLCPVLNRPFPSCLAGPAWRPERWLRLAAFAGIPVRDRHRPGGAGRDAPAATVTVVGRCAVGDADQAAAAHARRLAALAGVELLTAEFTAGERPNRLLGAAARVDVARPEVADALAEHLATAGAAAC